MIKFIDVTGKTEDEAIQSALAQLKMDRDDVSVEILERAKAGFLGIGSAPARVRVSYDDGKAEEVKPAEKPAAPKPEKKVEPASAPKAVPMYAPEVLQKKESRANDKPRTERGDRPAREDRRENRAPRAERAERPAPQPKPIVDLGEECHDEKSEQIRAFLKGLLEHMDSAAEVKVYESEKGRYKVFLEGEKLGALIGRRGETLDAIQQLTNYSINPRAGRRRKLPRKARAEPRAPGGKGRRQGDEVPPQCHPRAHERLRAPRHPHRAPGYAECDNVLHRHRAEPSCGRFVRPHQGVIKGGHSLSQKRMAPFRSPKRKVSDWRSRARMTFMPPECNICARQSRVEPCYTI